MLMSRLVFLGVASLLSTTAYGLINPIAVYTPLVSVTQAATLQVLTTQPTVTQPSQQSSTSSGSESNNLSPQSGTGIPIAPNTIGTQGHQFSTEGCYQLSGSGSFTGTSFQLLVTQSNIVIDLNGQILSYGGPSSQIVGCIVINPGVTNVTIKNGTIAGFTGPAITVNGSSTSPVSHIALDTIKIISCNPGIFLSYTDHAFISNCTIAGSYSNISAARGIFATNCSGITAQYCSIKNNISSNGPSCGYFFDTCKTIFLEHCTVSGNQGQVNAMGIHFKNVTRASYIQNCSAFSNTAITGDCCGILLEDSQNCYIQNSTTQNNTTTDPCGYSYGILLHDSANNFVKNNAVDGNNYGIYDDEAAGLQTNIYTQNIAYQNSIADYLRPYSSPFNFIQIQQDYLQKMLLTGTLDNLSIRISS